MYSIGEFSKITGLTIKALRLYHQEGILTPDKIDSQTGYRYYTPASLVKARTIGYLKEMLLPLDLIKSILENHHDEADVLSFLSAHRKLIAERLSSLETVAATLDEILHREMEAQTMLQKNSFEIEEKEVPKILIASIRWKGRYDQCGPAFATIYKKIGRYTCGKPMDLYYDEGKEENADVESAVPIRKGKEIVGIAIRELPGGKAISLIHKGPYDLIGHSYEKLTNYVKDRNLSYSPPIRQIYIKGPGLILNNPKNYLTEIQFIVK
jgi:DNA-binding transcriptional MerR regulator